MSSPGVSMTAGRAMRTGWSHFRAAPLKGGAQMDVQPIVNLGGECKIRTCGPLSGAPS